MTRYIQIITLSISAAIIIAIYVYYVQSYRYQNIATPLGVSDYALISAGAVLYLSLIIGALVCFYKKDYKTPGFLLLTCGLIPITGFFAMAFGRKSPVVAMYLLLSWPGFISMMLIIAGTAWIRRFR